MNIELKLLATMLYTGDFSPIVRGDITEEHFLTDSGKILYNFITTYKRSTGGAAQFPSLNTVRSRFKKGTLELPDPDPGDRLDNLTHETVIQKLRADLQEAATSLTTIATDSSDPMGDAMPILNKIRRSTESTVKISHSSIANGILEVTDKYMTGSILPNGIPYPWETMTRATKGLHRQEWVVVCGRPKSRKTFTALHMGVHAFKKSGARVLVFSPEMPTRQCLLRCVADLCGLHYAEFKDGTLDQAEEMRLFEAAELYGLLEGEDDQAYGWRLGKALGLPEGVNPSLDIVKSTSRDLTWMQSQLEMYKPDIVICDSFYRQRPEAGNRNEADWKVVSYLSRGLKDLMMDMNVAGIGTHQLNRGAQKTVGDLTNMGLSDAIGQDADLVIRVITGKHEGEDRSALVVLGGREVPFDGIMINNKPSYDFTEVGPITNMKTVEALMNQEGSDDDEEPTGGGGGGSKGKGKASGGKEQRKAYMAKVAAGASKLVDELDELPPEEEPS